MRKREEWKWRWNPNYLLDLEFYPKFGWSMLCPMMDRKIHQHDMTFLVELLLYLVRWMFSKENIYKLDDFFFGGKKLSTFRGKKLDEFSLWEKNYLVNENNVILKKKIHGGEKIMHAKGK
jgi:hypothetical protein